jgi:hypothetical protein
VVYLLFPIQLFLLNSGRSRGVCVSILSVEAPFSSASYLLALCLAIGTAAVNGRATLLTQQTKAKIPVRFPYSISIKEKWV